MWRQVGVERAEEPLAEALDTVEGWCRYVLPRQFADPQGWQLQNMLEVARLMIRSGLVRRETRGVHFRSDHPRADDAWRSHIVWRRDVTEPFLEPIPPAPVAAAGELLGHHGPRPLR
jgi:L-aspartate oxidase